MIEDFDTASVTPDTRINKFETPLPTSEAVRKYLTRNQDGYFGRRLYGRFASWAWSTWMPRDAAWCSTSATAARISCASTSSR